jgi:hypothetical protein
MNYCNSSTGRSLSPAHVIKSKTRFFVGEVNAVDKKGHLVTLVQVAITISRLSALFAIYVAYDLIVGLQYYFTNMGFSSSNL